MKKEETELATFAMGCFWKPDLLFSSTKGVIKATVGYIGGNEKKFPNPTYEQVCSDKSEYAEAVQLEYYPEKISYSELLDIFWKNHNPTTKNRQGPDLGSQYRSEIFYHTEEQKKTAKESKRNVQKKFDNKIITKITKAGTFFKAEEYHQDYLVKKGKQTCGI